MRPTLPLPFFCLTALLAQAAVAAAPPDGRLLDEVQRTYARTDQYQAAQQLEIREVAGRWTTTRSTDLRLAFDRVNQRLLIDRPDITLIVRDGRLYLKSDDIAGRHLETAAPSPLSYEALAQLVPVLGSPSPIELAFLLSAEPMAVLAGGQPARVEQQPPAEGDAEGSRRLQMITPPTTLTLNVARGKPLIQSALFEVDTDAAGMAPGTSVTMHFAFDIQRHNESIDPAVFDFEPPSGSTAVATFQELVQQGSAVGGGSHPLEGEAAPAVELETMAGAPFSLDDVEAEVVVFEFWATWCPPCRESLPLLQTVQDWADQEDLSVAIYAVNLEETVEQARAYWDGEGLRLPVLMDSDGTAARAYRLRALPQTVVIHKGKVAHVHVGVGPGPDERLKSQIRSLLEESR